MANDMSRPLLCLLLLAPALLAAPTFDYHSVRGRNATGVANGRIEGEDLPMRGAARVQGMRHFGPHWSGDAHLLWDGVVDGKMETSFEVPRAGRYRLRGRLTLAPDYGTFAVAVNGRRVAEHVDTYHPKVLLAPKSVFLGEHTFTNGVQSLSFTLSGAHADAKKFRGKGYLMGLDYLELESLDPPPEPEPKEEVLNAEPYPFAAFRTKLSSHCFRCHGEKKVKGKLNLETMNARSDFLAHPEGLQSIEDALVFGDMPPEDEEQPSPTERARLLATVRGMLAEHLSSATNEVPRVALRRLNRFEYNNVVRDVLELKGDIYPLPEKPLRAQSAYFKPASGRFPDVVQVGNRALGKNVIEKPILTGVSPFAIDLQAEHGFNNRSEELGLPPILLESYLKLAHAIVEAPEFDAYTRSKLFAAPAQEPLDHGHSALRDFLNRAFRHPVDDARAKRYLDYFEAELNRSGDYGAAMKQTVAAVLASPTFLYLVERKPERAEPQPLNAHELAARLAMFLWSGMPDAELRAAADDGSLLRSEVLRAQTERLLADPRSQALSQNFARQWLRLDQLINAVPDFERFPNYYARIGCEQWKFGLQTMIEPLLLFEWIMVEDRSVMLLVDSRHAWRSDELQSWYGDAKPFKGKANRGRFNTNYQTFRKRTLDNRREGGVLTSAAMLTMTSDPLRTNPINRGAWTLTVLFNQPPPPPPDVVPEIEADDKAIEAKGLTLRQRLKQHQENPSCAACHAKIDPLGFALENYDAVGRWRDTTTAGLPIDASGNLFGDAKFKDAVGLKDAMLAKPEFFLRGFSEHLLSYALGRELELADKPAVDRLLRDAIAEHGQFTTIVHGVVESRPFRRH